LCRPVLVIIYELVDFAIPIDIGDRVRIIGAPLCKSFYSMGGNWINRWAVKWVI
jgi:hypothetical protein